MPSIKTYDQPYRYEPTQQANPIRASFGALQCALHKAVNLSDLSELHNLNDLQLSPIENTLRPTLIPVVRDILNEHEQMLISEDEDDDTVTAFTPTEFNHYLLGALLATEDMLNWYRKDDTFITNRTMNESYLALTNEQIKKFKWNDTSSESYRLRYRARFLDATTHQFVPQPNEINSLLHRIQIGDTISVWDKDDNTVYRAYVDMIDIDESIAIDEIGYDPVDEGITPIFFYVTPIYDDHATATHKTRVDPLAVQAIIYSSTDIVIK